jgi:hypothetical protein
MDKEPRRAQRLILNPYVAILSAFAVSRVLYYLAGVRFQTNIVHFNFQFIDVDLLRHRLLESLFYYHMQPPLNNLMVGLAVKAFPHDYGAALHGVFVLMGALSALLLYDLMRYLDVPSRLAALLTILFATSPGCVLSENFPMYEYTVMALLLANCVALYRLLERPGFWAAFVFFSILAALALLRALFNLFYVLAVVAAVAYYLRPHYKTILWAAALPVLAIMALYLKNLALFGIFATSSWLGNNLGVVTTHQLTASERESLIASGKLDLIARVDAGSPVKEYRSLVPPLPPTGIPVLDQETKSTGGNNFNNQIYLKTATMYARAARQVLRFYPIAYFRSVLIAWFCYFRPSSDFFQFEENRAAIRRFERVYNIVVFGQLREASGKGLRALRSQGSTVSLALYTGLTLMVGLPAILLCIVGHSIQAYRRKSESANRLAVLSYIVLQIIMLALIVNFLSSFENNRYRFPTDPLYVALLGVLLAWFVRRFNRVIS